MNCQKKKEFVSFHLQKPKDIQILIVQIELGLKVSKELRNCFDKMEITITKKIVILLTAEAKYKSLTEYI